ncbi:hypothetical protein HKX48_006921 [Thoreauomyces humboldtii]|nr:hypothetical protein HKX48_006921 [Thoreauomyces humboldtii]
MLPRLCIVERLFDDIIGRPGREIEIDSSEDSDSEEPSSQPDSPSQPHYRVVDTFDRLQNLYKTFESYLERKKQLHKPKRFDTVEGYLHDYHHPYDTPLDDFWDDDGSEFHRFEANWSFSDRAIRAVLSHIRILKGRHALTQFSAVFRHIWGDSDMLGPAPKHDFWVKENVQIMDCDSYRTPGGSQYLHAALFKCTFTIKTAPSLYVEFESQRWKIYYDYLGDYEDLCYRTLRLSDGTLLARARTVWRTKKNEPPMQVDEDACRQLVGQLGKDWTAVELVLLLFAVGYAATAWPDLAPHLDPLDPEYEFNPVEGCTVLDDVR